MGERPQLVLDLAGVLISNFSTATWQALSLDSSEALQTLIEQIGIIRKDLWRGHLSENEFWEWLQERVPSFQAEAAGSTSYVHWQACQLGNG
ncbi:hypothetical protein [Paenibacillus sp. JCM 10914]|uniref:hypothetical protein n=1 Tax=Paenibacillus sp. JCM 10914 TaxID=1236974 RepID=UPI0003CC3533|nr:hypothetical protein [Paenibacillus sp. JCM 10914]GAE05185.1 hypothetical protein JCM10914_1276 [Paenibacillus sp. JCM 10914]